MMISFYFCTIYVPLRLSFNIYNIRFFMPEFNIAQMLVINCNDCFIMIYFK